MDTTTSSLPSTASEIGRQATPPFPRVPTSHVPSGAGATMSSIANPAHSALDTATDAGQEAMARVVSDLHDAVDGVADKAGPVARRLGDASQEAANLSRAWMDTARTAIRGRPLAAVSGALLMGAGLLALASFARRS